MTRAFWQLAVTGPRSSIEHAGRVWCDADELGVLSMSLFAANEDEAVCELIFSTPPDAESVLAVAGLTGDVVSVVTKALGDEDWEALAPSDQADVRIGRFHIVSEQNAKAAPEVVSIKLTRSEAFGLGEHASTRACLMVIDRLVEDGFQPEKILDVGCGSGILSIAAAKVWPNATIVASDIDEVAVARASDHARHNGVGPSIEFYTADGFGDPALAHDGVYDLVLMNILADPLIAMAKPAARALAEGGFIVLAGFYHQQADSIKDAYLAEGLHLRAGLEIDGWASLILVKGAQPVTPG